MEQVGDFFDGEFLGQKQDAISSLIVGLVRPEQKVAVQQVGDGGFLDEEFLGKEEGTAGDFVVSEKQGDVGRIGFEMAK